MAVLLQQPRQGPLEKQKQQVSECMHQLPSMQRMHMATTTIICRWSHLCQQQTFSQQQDQRPSRLLLLPLLLARNNSSSSRHNSSQSRWAAAGCLLAATERWQVLQEMVVLLVA